MALSGQVWPLIPPFLVGALLRLWNLPAQIIYGDEMHAIRAAVSMPLSRILTTYQVTDNCIPLTAFYRFLLDRGLALPEMALRLPIVLSGLLLLIAVPLLLVDRVGRRAALVVAWLLALSPILALYSGIVRSYMPVALLGSLAVLSFESWWRTGRSRAAVGYVVTAALAVWFHLGTAPLVASPFLFALGDLALGGNEDGGARIRRLLLLAAALAAAIALLVGPAIRSLLELIAQKHAHQPIPGRTLLAVLSLQAGTARPALIVLFWLATSAGLFLLLRRDRRFGIYTLCLVGGQLLGILLLSPIGMPHPLIFDRYLIPVLPILLLWAAVALARLTQLAAAPIGWGLTAIFLVALAVFGPYADPRFLRSSFRLSNDFVGFYQPRASLPPEAVPDFYRRLGTARDGGAVLEFPCVSWGFASLYLYQEVHHRRVVAATPQQLLVRAGLRNMVAPQPPAMCASGARYLVVHLHIAREEDRVEETAFPPPVPMDRPSRREYRAMGEGLARRLEGLWGDPLYADDDVEAWDLRRVCGGAAALSAIIPTPSP